MLDPENRFSAGVIILQSCSYDKAGFCFRNTWTLHLLCALELNVGFAMYRPIAMMMVMFIIIIIIIIIILCFIKTNSEYCRGTEAH